MKKVLVLAAAMMAVVLSAKAEVEFAYEAGADLVSAYLWRGQYNGGLSFQPEALVGFNAKDEAIQFRAGAWGNIGASDWKFKKDQGDGTGYTMFMPEVDFMATLFLYGLNLGFTEYYYCDDFKTATSEVTLGYNFSHFFGEKAGAYFNWNTTVAGNDFITDGAGNDVRAWSSYLEVGYDYTFEKPGITLSAQVGMSPWASDMYGNSGFAVTNIALKLDKEWEFDKCSLNLFAQGSLNPDGINKGNIYINEAGEDKLYLQKLNGCIGVGVWF
ncbi:MAG: hypothetical protein IKR37_04990 [Paludibacteraceae bacterium]|nr:hypothetical protein [Paludibacteraceae bacterium]